MGNPCKERLRRKRAPPCSSNLFQKRSVISQVPDRDLGAFVRRDHRDSTIRRRLLVTFGVLLVLAGVGLAVCQPFLFKQLLLKELPLTPGSSSFHIWRTTPVPMHIDFYFWNWTNPEMISLKGVKPAFVQMGPYRFTETREKVNITWNRNGTVTFRQVRRWWFDSEKSAGTLSDNITTVNIVAMTAAHVVRDWSYFTQHTVSIALSTTGQTLAITRTAGELLFDGYTDPLINIARRVPGLSSIDVPFDKFGWFYMRNGSSVADGVLNMYTGTPSEESEKLEDSGIDHLGVLDRWNYNTHTPYYQGDCGQVFGSAGELWPPGQHDADNIALFSTDLCRALWLGAMGSTTFESIPGRLFAGGPLLLDNFRLDGDTSCFCNGECMAAGVLNVTACRYGAPAFVSLPHFLLAHHSYRDAVTGMQPDPSRHNLYIILEPTTGIPLDVAARFQINLLLQRSKYISMLNKIPKRVLVPVIWFEQRASITPELGVPLRLLLRLPLLLRLSSGLLFATGLLLALSPILFPLFPRCRQLQTKSDDRSITHLPESPLCLEKAGLSSTSPLLPLKPQLKGNSNFCSAEESTREESLVEKSIL